MTDSFIKSLEEVEQRISSMCQVVFTRQQEEIQSVRDKIEEMEQQIAMLIMGYGEAAVMIEGLLAQLNFSTQEEKDAFFKTMTQARNYMLQVMQEHGGLEPKDTGTGTPMANMVSEDDTPSAM